jgi:hypothetical protein
MILALDTNLLIIYRNCSTYACKLELQAPERLSAFQLKDDALTEPNYPQYKTKTN